MIRNLDDLLANMLTTIESLQNDEIEVEDAVACAKLYNSVIELCKLKVQIASKQQSLPSGSFLSLGAQEKQIVNTDIVKNGG